ncbi:MAG: GDSL-type esterase/lipase family protein, partial [Opitutales bacterium]
AVETATGVQAILDELQATLPAETNILLLGILPRGVSESESLEWQRNDEVNALIAECANDPQITYLDIGHVFENEDGSMRTELMYDQYVHPNTDGYAAWAEAMEDTVLSLTGPPDWGP